MISMNLRLTSFVHQEKNIFWILISDVFQSGNVIWLKSVPPYFEKFVGRIGLDKWVSFSVTIGCFLLKLCRIVDEIISFRTDTDSVSQILFFFFIFIFLFIFLQFPFLLLSIFLQNNNLQNFDFPFQKTRSKTDMGTLRYWHCHSNCQQIWNGL